MSAVARRQAWIGSLMVALAIAGTALGDASALARRLPPGANAIAFINVDGLINSKLGKEEDWRSKLSDAYSVGPLFVPPDAKHVMMASWLEPTNMEPIWEASVIRVGKTLSMDRIAKNANGFTEGMGNRMAAWTPANAYFIRLEATMLGVVCPADRQFAARWCGRTDGDDGALTPYLRAAVEKIVPDTEYMFAIDLQDAVSEKRCRRRLEMDEFASLAGKDINARRISEIVASLKGLTLFVEVGSEISGKCTIDFGQPTDELASYAKPMLTDALERVGASIDDIKTWKFSAKGSTILANGKLSTEGLRALCSIINPPNPGHTDESGAADANDTADKAKDPAVATAPSAAASKQYYRAVSKIIDGFGKRVREASSLTAGATYVARDARNIGRLPILNVDPELIKWALDVNMKLLEVGSALGVGGFQARARAEGVMNPEAANVTWGDLEASVDPNAEINRQNAARARRAATAEEKARVLQQATQALMELEAGRAQIRAAMTQKHKTEF